MTPIHSLASLILLWMALLVPSSPWLGDYPEEAQAIADACSERPVFGSPMRCAAVLVAIAYHESRFDPRAIGDGGRSISPWQISKHWKPGTTLAEQAQRAVSLLEESRRICHGMPPDEQLGWYCSGGAICGRPASSRIRMHLAASLMR